MQLTRGSGTRLTSSLAPTGNLKLLQTGSIESKNPIGFQTISIGWKTQYILGNISPGVNKIRLIENDIKL